LAGTTGIDWCDATLNVFTWHCTPVGIECANCYAQTWADKWHGAGFFTSGPPELKPARLLLPWLDAQMRAAMLIFLASMSDPFHRGISIDDQALVWAMMAADRRHIYQVLTKRSGIMCSRLSSPEFAARVRGALDRLAAIAAGKRVTPARRAILDDIATAQVSMTWPLPNVWAGVSCGTQPAADRRGRHLLRTPAATRFLSVEPLLEPVRLTLAADRPGVSPLTAGPSVDWVICGGESGSRHRPLDLDWARSVRDQCVDAGVPFWFKQVGGLTPRARGDLLDGQAWKQMPGSAPARTP
jgi:protein gp37